MYEMRVSNQHLVALEPIDLSILPERCLSLLGKKTFITNSEVLGQS
jgi:hypothetical protein